MRRSTRLGLAAAILLLVAIGVYAAFWFVAASRVEDGLRQWAEEQRAHNLDFSWRAVDVGGFPLSFRITLREARLRGMANPGAGELAVPVLSASTQPWRFRVWDFAAPQGLSATAGEAGLKLTARTAVGNAAVGDNGAAIWLGLDQPKAEIGVPLAAREASIWVNLPPHPPQTHTEPTIGVAVDAQSLTGPTLPPALQKSLDDVALGITVKGPVPPSPVRQAAAAWRDAGGTLEVDRLALRWEGVAVTGSGTMALDADLQPIGAFSGAVQGYNELIAALVATGTIRENDARLARVALGMLAKRGPDGRPQIATSFTIQNGEMALGPLRLGKLPRIRWE